MKHTEAKDIASKIDSGIDQVAEKVHLVQDKIEHKSQELVEYIKAHPVKSTLVAGLACYILGRLMK